MCVEKLTVTVLILGVLATLKGIEGKTAMALANLTASLFANYDGDNRPQCGDEAVQLRVGLALRQIIDMNERQQILEINAWIRMNWEDCYLNWNANETGISSLVLPYDKVWVPDITLYDNAENKLGGLKDYRASVSSDGSVSYNFPTIIRSLCKVDVTYFPFDVQNCPLTFGSWAYHGFDLNVTKRAESGDTSSYIANVEWEIVSVPAVRHELKYGCCPEPYPDVTFYLIMRRKPLFYMLNLLFPCMLISTVAILGFLLPPDSGEKVSLEITVLLSLAVFLLVVSETMPPTSETFPYIGVYFAMAMLLVSLSCLMTVTVLNLHFRGGHGKEVPACIRQLLLFGLGKILCVKIHRRNHTVFPMAHENNVHEIHGSTRSAKLSNGHTTILNGHATTDNHTRSMMDVNEVNARNKPVQVTELDGSTEVVDLLHRQLDILRRIEVYVDRKKSLEETVEEWQKLSQVVDRLFLIIFIVIQVVTTLSILLRISTADP